MKWIAPPGQTAEKLCGMQKERKDCSYRPTTHCLKADCEEGTLWFHTLTGALVLLPPSDLYEHDRQELIQKRFLVPDDFDERAFTDQVQKISRMFTAGRPEKRDFTVFTTTDCNARCFYCYELGVRRIPMTAETALDTAAYIPRVSGGKAVKILWFGGEPLYNREAIDIICGSLRKNSVEWESSMISNGFYLDAETAKHAVEEWNLTKVQITIDGTEEVYNQTKAYIDADENPYQRVVRNIRSALDAGIEVTIRLNMDASNSRDLLVLADELAGHLNQAPKPEIYVALLHDFSGGIRRHETDRLAEHAYFALCDRLEEHGLLKEKKPGPALRSYSCMADNDNAEVILPDGRIARCEHPGEDVITGSIYNNERDEEITRRWKEPLLVPECGNCALYPRCGKLRMCEWNREGCSELSRRIMIQEIKKQMLKIYTEYKEGGTTK